MCSVEIKSHLDSRGVRWRGMLLNKCNCPVRPWQARGDEARSRPSSTSRHGACCLRGIRDRQFPVEREPSRTRRRLVRTSFGGSRS